MIAPYWQIDGSTLYQGHVLDVLAAMAAGSVQCAVTSPPYWSLRDYGLPPVEWPPVRYAPMAGLPEIEVPGCEPGCEHEWGESIKAQASNNNARGATGLINSPEYTEGRHQQGERASQGQYCHLCGGWRGGLGLEPTPEMYVGHLVLVWRELRRVLRDDGVCWLDLGDSSSTGKKLPIGDKQVLGMPWRVAFALQADKWIVRSDVIWAKGVSFCREYSGSCMPESVRDRPTKAHEYVFLLSKSARYYYDQEAVRESTSMDSGFARQRLAGNHHQRKQASGFVRDASSGSTIDTWTDTGSRNLRTVWAINPGSYPGAHYATFPPALVEPMIRAGTSARGCCPECGAPWERVIDVTYENPGNRTTNGPRSLERRHETAGFPVRLERRTNTLGWRPGCACSGLTIIDDQPCKPSRKKGQSEISYIADLTAWKVRLDKWVQLWESLAPLYEAEPKEPCTVGDIFAGSGTVGAVARQLGRRWVLIELSKEYCDEHIIPRLEEPLIEWAEEQPEPTQPEAIQMGLL